MKDYWCKLDSRLKQNEKLRFNYIMTIIDQVKDNIFPDERITQLEVHTDSLEQRFVSKIEIINSLNENVDSLFETVKSLENFMIEQHKAISLLEERIKVLEEKEKN